MTEREKVLRFLETANLKTFFVVFCEKEDYDESDVLC